MSSLDGGRTWRGLVGLVAAAFFLSCFYLWTASAGVSLGFGEVQDRPYDLLARALLHGQLQLPIDPRPELFELTDPYDPGRNAPYRYHDASLYHGRYYLYFGVVPALTAFVPWRLIGLGDLPEPAAAVAFALVGFVFSALLLRHLLLVHLEAAPGSLAQFLAFLVLGSSNLTPFLLRSSHVYELAIAAGYAFCAGAAFFFASSVAGGVRSRLRLALAGLLLGLAVGCRPNLVFLVPVLPLLALPGRASSSSARSAARSLLAVLAPLAVCGVALGAYNLARFGSWTEFGTRYQLVGVPRIPTFEARAVAPTLYYDFLAPPSLRSDFPFVFPDHDWKGSLPDGYFLDSSTTGALLHSPFLAILLALPWVLRRARLREPEVLRWRLLTLVAAGLAVALLTAFAFASVAMRFQADFLHLLIVPALVAWFALATLPVGKRRWALRVLVLVVFGWSAFASVAISITGVDPLRLSNPDLFAKLERRAEPLQRLVARLAYGRSVDVPFRVAFPESLATDAEPFLSWGTPGAFDVVWVRAVSPGVFSFSLDSAALRSGSTASAEARATAAFVPGRFYDVAVEIDRAARRVRVSVGGGTRFELEGRLVPVTSRRVWLGRGPRGPAAPSIGRFSGTLVPEAMWLAGPPGLASLPPIARGPAILTASREAAPRAGTPGLLWVVAGRRGGFLRTDHGWRWIPVATLAGVRFEPDTREALGLEEAGVLPLLALGRAEGAEVVALRRVSGTELAVALARFQGAWTFEAQGARIERTELAAHALRVELGQRDDAVVVSLDDRVVLQARREAGALRPEELLVGRIPGDEHVTTHPEGGIAR